jgi:hypothetical protein
MGDPVTEVVRTFSEPRAAWRAVRDAVAQKNRSPLWTQLPDPDVTGDVAEATRWLRSEVAAWRAATANAGQAWPQGIYLGLDTLNMDGPSAFNVALGGKRDIDDQSTDWLFEQDWRPQHAHHLIAGLRDLHRIYQGAAWQSARLASVADYWVVLGYSGIVLTSACEALFAEEPVEDDAAAAGQVRVMWGFHDGDLYDLVRREAGVWRRVCEVE